MTVANRVLTIAGKVNGGGNGTSVSSYDIKRNTWQGHLPGSIDSSLPKLNVPRFDPSACVLKGTIYVFGGEINFMLRINGGELRSTANSIEAIS